MQLAAQSGCIQIAFCPNNGLGVCDLTNNDANLWNESYWNDAQYNDHDLRETSVGLGIEASSTCGATLSIRYELLLDLDNDGIQETVLNSNALPGFNTILYDNVANTGTPRAFDERPVPANDKYGFAQEDSIGANSIKAFVRWNTQAAPNTFISPELPYGTHKIRWIVEDNLSNQEICTYTFIEKDCKNPTVVCINALSASIMPTGTIQIWATDFLQYVEDNATPTNLLQLAIRKSGTGTGFPTDTANFSSTGVAFNCSELGFNQVELWAKDLAGNADYCEVSLTLQDTNFICDPSNATLKFCTRLWYDQSPIEGVELEFTETGTGWTVFQSQDHTDANGCGSVTGIPGQTNITVTPTLESDPLNGVDILYLVLIRKHILGIQPLAPYAKIAADAGGFGGISTYDIVQLTKLLLGLYTTLPYQTSWKFVDADFVFPNPNNPFETVIPPMVTLSNLPKDTLIQKAFVGIKTGDVNGTAYPGFKAPIVEDRAPLQALTLHDYYFKAGEILEIPLYFEKSARWLGFQFGLAVKNERLQVLEAKGGPAAGLNQDNFGLLPDAFQCVWSNAQPVEIPGGAPLFTLRVQALEDGWLHDALALRPSEQFKSIGYLQDESKNRLELVFTPSNQVVGSTSVGQLRPNPTTGNALIPIELAQKSNIQLEVFGLDGKLQWSQQQEREKGIHQLEIPAIAIPQTGIYTWRLLVNGQLYQGKLVRA
jgi:hypothetical protein